jgi:lysophospholipase L1-like esterase
VETDAVGGTGYLNDGQSQRFGLRIPGLVAKYAADYVIVAGGMNDQQYPVDRVIATARQDLTILGARTKAKIIVFSPFSNGAPVPRVKALDDALRGLANSLGYRYVDVTRFLPNKSGLIGKDRVHPTDAGHRLIEHEIAAALSDLPDARVTSG